jgi:ribosomal protein S18 acetylase RimI-like enzyme
MKRARGRVEPPGVGPFEKYMTINIRKADLNDAQSIRNIDSIVPCNPSRAEMIDTWLQKDFVLVAEMNNRIIGYGVLNHEFFRQSQIDMLMISTECRGKRIGEMLLLSLEKYADTAKMFITTNLSNHSMQKLLFRNGYKPCGYIEELDPGDPELVFVKQMIKDGIIKK